jgi:mono/diheme cytochrome c family protein
MVRSSTTAALVAAVFFSSGALAQTTNGGAKPAGAVKPAPPAGDPDAESRGKRVYYQNCARCHGLNMVVASSAFFDLRTFPADDKPRFIDSVTNGKRVMPAWGATLKPEEIESLWAYVMTAKK